MVGQVSLDVGACQLYVRVRGIRLRRSIDPARDPAKAPLGRRTRFGSRLAVIGELDENVESGALHDFAKRPLIRSGRLAPATFYDTANDLLQSGQPGVTMGECGDASRPGRREDV